MTLQPLRLGVDAAILFADILLPLEPMGAPFEFAKGEGPVIHEPIARRAQIDALRVIDPEEGLGYVLEAIRLLRKELTQVPLIGFAGAPFTLASYLVEGGKSAHFAKTKRLMYTEPDAWHALMGKLAEVVRPLPRRADRRRGRVRAALRLLGRRPLARGLRGVRAAARRATS